MKKSIYLFISILVFLAGLIGPVSCTVRIVQFDQKCGGYIKQAADANVPELALERLNLAIDYIEANNLTDGYTSIFFKTEDENVKFWYQNIIACQNELKSCLESSQLEKTNVLMKVRESLSHTPPGIQFHPHNGLWAFGEFISFIAIIIGALWFLIIRTND